MMVQVEREQALIGEALDILLEHMPAHKVARLLAAWQVGRGDYTELRRRLFADETVETLAAKVRDFEQQRDA